MEAIFVANRKIEFETCSLTVMKIPDEEETADDYILRNILPYDLAVTRDIPLAARLIERDAVVINDRGDRFDRDSIAVRLERRDWTLQLKEAGLAGPGGRSYGAAELKRFADRFDREFNRLLRL